MVVHPKPRAKAFARTVIMAASSLLLVVALYVIYQRTSANDPLGDLAPTPSADGGASQASPPPKANLLNGEEKSTIDVGGDNLTDKPAIQGPEDVPIRGGDAGAVEYYDERGRKWLSVHFRTWRPADGAKNEVEIDEPVIRFRTPRGQLIRAEADRGHLSLRTLSGSSQEPKSGNLEGNVRITVDRLSDAQRQALPDEERENLDDARRVNVEMESVYFDLELSQVRSPGAFRIRSIETDIQGRGLSLRFNELESRIESLVITEGKSIELRGMGDQFAIDLENGEEDGERDGGGKERANVKVDREPPPTPVVPATEADPVDMDSDGVPILRPEEPARSTTRPTDVYTAVFEKDVRVIRFAQELVAGQLAADRLQLLFDFSDKQRDLARRNPHAAPPTETDETKETPESEDRVLLTWSGSLTVESTRSESALPKESGEQKTGGDESSFKPQRLEVTAEGRRVELSDPTRSVVCRKLIYADGTGRATLIGDSDQPAVVSSQGMGRLSATRIDMDRSGGTASAVGSGRLETLDANGETGLGARDFAVEFGERLDATFRVIEASKYDPATGTFKRSKRQVLEQARFSGTVDMRHGEEKVRCDRIVIDFGLDENGNAYPTRADAYVDVVAFSGDRFIRATKRMILDLEPIETPRPAFDMTLARAEAVRKGQDPDAVDWDAIRRKYEAKRDFRPGLKRLQAFGEVEVRDPQQAFEVSAEQLDCSFSDGRNIERGLVTPRIEGGSYVRFGDFSVATPKEIPFDVVDQRIEISGPGRMTFPATQDLDGGKLDEPKLVRVGWLRSMRFAGDQNRATFEGQVRAKTDGSNFESESMRIDFKDIQPTPSNEKAAPKRDWWIFEPLLSRETKSTLPPIELASSRKRKEPTYLYATGGVKAVTRQFHDGTTNIATRMLITGPTLAVDPVRELMSVEGAGSLLIEDYKSIHATANSSKEVVTPFGKMLPNESSQTYVSWANNMVYRYRANETHFAGDVQVSHRTAGKMKMVAELQRDGAPAPPPGVGREASLRCNTLDIRFLRDSATDTAGASRISGNEVDSFAARGKVMFEDSGISAIADAIIYHRIDAALQILGSDTEDAQLFDQRQRFTTLKGPKFHWDRNTNQISVHKSSAHIR